MLFVGLHRALEREHRTVEGVGDHMADSAAALHTAVAEGIDLGEGRYTAVAEVEDSPAVVDMGYARELHMAAAVVGDTALVVVLAVVDILAARAVVGGTALAVGPAVLDIRLAARNLEGGLESRHNLAGVGNLVVAVDILEEDTAEVEAADIRLLMC